MASSQISGWPAVTVSPTAAPTRATEPGIGASSEPVRDRASRGRGSGAGRPAGPDPSGESTNTSGSAVARDVEGALDAVDGEDDPVRRRGHQVHGVVVPSSSSPPRPKPVPHLVRRHRRRRRTPCSGSPTPRCASRWAGRRKPLRCSVVRGVGQRGGQRGQRGCASGRPAARPARPGRGCRRTRCRWRRRGTPDGAAR